MNKSQTKALKKVFFWYLAFVLPLAGLTEEGKQNPLNKCFLSQHKLCE